MGKLAAVTCETAKPNKARDRLLGDGDGLFLRIRPHGTKTWVIEYEFRVRCRQGSVPEFCLFAYCRGSSFVTLSPNKQNSGTSFGPVLALT